MTWTGALVIWRYCHIEQKCNASLGRAVGGDRRTTDPVPTR
jgi:hypothetical protein